MTRKHSSTDDAIQLVRGLSGAQKALVWVGGSVVALGAIIGGFNAAVQFVASRVVEIRFQQYEKDRRTSEEARRLTYRAETKQAMKDLDARMDAVERKLIQLEASSGSGRERRR